MIRRLRVRHFRGFEDLAVGDLSRVNLFTGPSGVGKTALLEAVFLMLGPGNPELSVWLNVLRGLGKVPADPEEIWGWLFRNRQTERAVELHSEWSSGAIQILTLSLVEQGMLPLGSGESGGEIPPSGTSPTARRGLVLAYRDSSGIELESRAKVAVDGSVGMEFPKYAGAPPGIFLTCQARSPRDDAARFSRVEELGRENEILASLKVLEPRLTRVAVAAVAGSNEPVLRADVGLGRLIPVAMLGSGLGRLLSIVLAINTAPGGVVLVDEIENGMHHSRLRDVWRAIRSAALAYDAQILATTNSWECVKAAHDAFADGGADDLRVHRLERRNDRVEAITYDREALGAAMGFELEVR